MNEWYEVENRDEIDSPALLVYPDRIMENIRLALQIAGGADRLRPHVKTHKMARVCRMLSEAGVTRYKCATIAEAEMLANEGAEDVLLAYQPVGPKIDRLIRLIKAYPHTSFSCLTDCEENAAALSVHSQGEAELPVYIDLNIGMNRTGIAPEKAPALAQYIRQLPGLKLTGLHGYDGHIHARDIVRRKEESDQAFACVETVYRQIAPLFTYPLKLVIGGTPTFPMHASRTGCECSPGTFVFWDAGYARMLPDQPFRWAALVMTRVVSVIDGTHICVDLGHKAVAAENPLPRVYFLNAPEADAVSQSEEHLVLRVPDSSIYKPGDVLYGVPVHICPTVALYDEAWAIREHRGMERWEVTARKRMINF